jgi:hypothetical protein
VQHPLIRFYDSADKLHAIIRNPGFRCVNMEAGHMHKRLFKKSAFDHEVWSRCLLIIEY